MCLMYMKRMWKESHTDLFTVFSLASETKEPRMGTVFGFHFIHFCAGLISFLKNRHLFNRHLFIYGLGCARSQLRYTESLVAACGT